MPAPSLSSQTLSPVLPTPANINSDFQVTLSTSYPIPAHGLHGALSQLNRKTHEAVNAITARVKDGKGTGASYTRHIRNYEKYWAAEERCCTQDDPTSAPIPAYPITAGKVAKFLLYETRREKVCTVSI